MIVGAVVGIALFILVKILNTLGQIETLLQGILENLEQDDPE